MMKAFILVLLSGITLGSYVENEFILRLDEEKLSTSADEKEFIDELIEKYNIVYINSRNIGSLKFITIEGDDKYMEEIAELANVKYLNRNNIGKANVCEQQRSRFTWGLDRIDQREKLNYGDPVFEDAQYIYGEREGDGVSVYVVDSGIEIANPEFEVSC